MACATNIQPCDSFKLETISGVCVSKLRADLHKQNLAVNTINLATQNPGSEYDQFDYKSGRDYNQLGYTKSWQ